MPIYEYRCRKGHVFEVMQSMSDKPVTSCQECQAPVERVFHPIAVHFKGSGFYSTDYGRNRGASGGSSDSRSRESESTGQTEKSGTPEKAGKPEQAGKPGKADKSKASEGSGGGSGD